MPPPRLAQYLLMTVALLAWPLAVGGADDERLVIIVHPERRAQLSVEDVAQIYLRRKRFWDDGGAIAPLNLSSDAALRRRFARRVLRLPEPRLADYWNRQYYNGVLPPATLASTEAMRRYVAADPKAIGYLPASEADGSVRVILQLD